MNETELKYWAEKYGYKFVNIIQFKNIDRAVFLTPNKLKLTFSFNTHIENITMSEERAKKWFGREENEKPQVSHR